MISQLFYQVRVDIIDVPDDFLASRILCQEGRGFSGVVRDEVEEVLEGHGNSVLISVLKIGVVIIL
jgi:hypothetical protein